MTLDELSVGHSGVITEVGGEGILRCRLLDMGLIPQTRIRVRVIFGEPYSITDIDLEDHVACQQAADALLKTIYQLGGDAYADQIGKDSGLLLRR